MDRRVPLRHLQADRRVLTVATEQLDRRAAQAEACAAFDQRAQLIPVRARCGTCRGDVARRVSLEPGWLNVGHWTHADPNRAHPVTTVTFRGEQ